VELVREPDAQLGYLAFGWVTMGQVLSLPMVFLGIWMFWWAHRKAEQSHKLLNPNRFYIYKFPNAVHGQFASVARGLDAPKGRRGSLFTIR